MHVPGKGSHCTTDAGFGSSVGATGKGLVKLRQAEKQLLQEQEERFKGSPLAEVGQSKAQVNSVLLITDIIGTNFNMNRYVSVLAKPAATMKTWSDSIRMGDVRFN